MTSILDTKNRCPDLADVRTRLRGHSRAEHRSTVPEQRDTYFVVSHGWLKLRDHDLVAYHRGRGCCEYALVRVADPAACRAALAGVLGIRVEVRKRREIWVVGTSVVHLDEVAGLGDFVEVETPAEATGAAVGHDHVRHLLGVDGIESIGRSYADLLA